MEGRRTSFAGGCFSIFDDESVCCDSKSESVISYPSFARCFYVMSGLQFGLLVDFARSQWSDDVFQEFVDSWKSVYTSPTCKAVQAYAFDRSIVEVHNEPVAKSFKANIFDKVKRRLLMLKLQVSAVRYEVKMHKDIACLSMSLRPERSIFPEGHRLLGYALSRKPLPPPSALPSEATGFSIEGFGFAEQRITALRIQSDALTQRLASTQASEQSAKASILSVTAALEAERARSEDFQTVNAQLQASADNANAKFKRVHEINLDLQLDLDWLLSTQGGRVIERSELNSARRRSRSPRR